MPMSDSDHVERNESLAKVYSTAVNIPVALMFAPTSEFDAISALVIRLMIVPVHLELLFLPLLVLSVRHCPLHGFLTTTVWL